MAGPGVAAAGVVLSVEVGGVDSTVVACRATCGSPLCAALMARGSSLLASPVTPAANAPLDDGPSALCRHTITGFGAPDEAA